jgi:hypothetical protein
LLSKSKNSKGKKVETPLNSFLRNVWLAIHLQSIHFSALYPAWRWRVINTARASVGATYNIGDQHALLRAADFEIFSQAFIAIGWTMGGRSQQALGLAGFIACAFRGPIDVWKLPST